MTEFYHYISFNCQPYNFPLPKRKKPIVPRVQIVMTVDWLQATHPALGRQKSGLEMAHDMFDGLYQLGLEPIFSDSDGFRTRCWMQQKDLEAAEKLRSDEAAKAATIQHASRWKPVEPPAKQAIPADLFSFSAA